MTRYLPPMKEEEKKATESTQGLIEVVSKHDLTKGEMLLRRTMERKRLAAYREMVLLPRQMDEGE